MLISLVLVFIGSFVIYETQGIAETQGYSQVGPRLFPYIIGTGLTLCGAVLGWHAISGGWRDVPLDQPGHDAPDWMAFGDHQRWHRAAHGADRLGRLHHRVDLDVRADRARFRQQARRARPAVGLALAVAAYFLFTRALGLRLPPGPFGALTWAPSKH